MSSSYLHLKIIQGQSRHLARLVEETRRFAMGCNEGAGVFNKWRIR